VDFQTILPALVICLQSADPETRTAALDCIAVQRSLAEQRFSAVYAFDAIYGESEGVYCSLSSFRRAAKLRHVLSETSISRSERPQEVP
jgi:hypothetical protein